MRVTVEARAIERRTYTHAESLFILSLMFRDVLSGAPSYLCAERASGPNGKTEEGLEACPLCGVKTL